MVAFQKVRPPSLPVMMVEVQRNKICSEKAAPLSLSPAVKYSGIVQTTHNLPTAVIRPASGGLAAVSKRERYQRQVITPIIP